MNSSQFFQPPRLRVNRDSASEDRHATWLELFYDLVFVAAVSQLALKLSDEYSIVGLIRFAALFVPIWWAWVGHTFYLTRFDSDDAAHRLMTLAQMIFVASLAIHVPQGLENHAAGFALSYVGVRAILIAQYWRAGKYIPEAYPLTNRYARGFAVSAALWLVSAFVPSPWRFVLWAIAMVIDILTPLGAGLMHAKIPPHFSHLPERFGLFTIIVLGESVVATVQGAGKEGLEGASVVSALCGLIIAFALWWIYFNDVRAAETREVKSSSDVVSYQTWLYTHLPLTMAIVAAAVGVKHILTLESGEQLPAIENWIFCASVAIAMECLRVIFLHTPNTFCGPRIRQNLRRHDILAAMVLVCAPIGIWISSTLMMIAVAVLCVAQAAISLRPNAHEE